jgi:hypothetical protein
MKKLFIAALFAFTIGSSAFAAGTDLSDAAKLSYSVKSSFEKHFREAQDVSWTVRESFVKASFSLLGQRVEAFFGDDGELIGTSRKVQFERLPVLAVSKIRKEYEGYAVGETIELTKYDDTNYYVSLSKGEKKQILEVTPSGHISVFHPVR